MPWPASLPPLFKGVGYDEIEEDGAYRTPMSSGPGKSRPRPDTPNTQIPRTQILTLEQYATFKQFRDVELSNGSLPFDEFHPRTKNAVTLRFKGQTQMRYENGYAMTSFTLEVIS